MYRLRPDDLSFVRGALVRGAIALMAALFLLLAPTGGASGAGPFFVEGVAIIPITLPEVLLGTESNSTCLGRMETDDSNIGSIRVVCYSADKPEPVPPPPPPPYAELSSFTVSGPIDQTDGSVSMAFLGGLCLASDTDDDGENDAGLAVALTFTANKAGGLEGFGSFRLAYDQTGDPFDCIEEDFFADQPFTPTILAMNDNYDGDGCTTWEELGTNPALGGQRDPWNPWDFYDVNGDQNINVFDDILVVAGAFGQVPGDPDYSEAKDRGPELGPNGWNREGPNGNINVFDDILGVASQFGHNCAGEPN